MEAKVEPLMTFIDINKLPVIERLPGWRGRYFDSANMTFGHYEFDAGASIHEHSHPQEEVWQILEGELEITIDRITRRAGPGFVGIVPPIYASCRKGNLSREGYCRGLSCAESFTPSSNALVACHL